jgi:CheY-like chemotaxis protein
MLKKIVVAEDDDAIAHMVSMALGDAGYLCIRARDGEEALQITKMHQPDLLVLDVMMPKMDGREVATRLKQDVLLSKIPILMLTALADVDSKIQGLDAGADDHVGKPFDLRELAARIRALIRANQRERDRNGTTDLPGSTAVDKHIAGILSSTENRAVIQVGVAGFGALISEVGQVDSTEFIKLLANFILTELRGQEVSFLGHLGGTDFITSCPPDKSDALCRSLVEGFDKNRAFWVGPQAGQAGERVRLLVGVAMSKGLEEKVLAKRLASAVSDSRRAEGSNYVVSAEIS